MEYRSGIYLLYGLSVGKWKVEMGGAAIMKLRAKKKEGMNLATEIISMAKRKLWRCRIALIISLVGNVIQAAVLIFR